MDEAIGYIIGAGIIIAIVVAIIAILVAIGPFLLASVALVGAVSGLGVAANNFVGVLKEAHKNVPR